MWQQAMALAESIYGVLKHFPNVERYSLADQLRRAAVSIPSNIAEGKGYRTDRDFLRFLYHARGSLFELETQLMLAAKLQYLSADEFGSLLQQVEATGSSLTGLINSLEEHVSAAAQL